MATETPAKLHILGICGTFMGGVAVLARHAGFEVAGSDQGIYPPMSDMLREQGIALHQGYDPGVLGENPGEVVIGNALSRGNPAVEHVLRRRWPYTSGPAWLATHVLRDRWVLAVAGTHGKTTTASLLAWILEYAGLAPGFLIGGVPGNFGVSARLGGGSFFVLEADEYDSAFFDKRSKFVHFHPDTLVINNIEYDHADIFPDLAAIQRQFHHLVRTVPDDGLIIANGDDRNVAETLAMGCWTPLAQFGNGAGLDWQLGDGGPVYRLTGDGEELALTPPLPGAHNAGNAVAALLAARHAGVPLATGVEALARFQGVKRRMELRGEVAGIQVIDDFAHHPTAVAATLAGMPLRDHGRVLAVLEPRSNTMRLGVHKAALADSLAGADACFLLQPGGMDWDVAGAVTDRRPDAIVDSSVAALAERVVAAAQPGDRVLVMSNGAFGGIHELILDGLRRRFQQEAPAG